MKKNGLLSKLYQTIIRPFVVSEAKVDVWGMCYEKINDDDVEKSIKQAKIIDAHTGDSWQTDNIGYAHINAKPGRKLTLIFEPVGYAKVQTATVIVPKGGLTGEFNELTFQTPSDKLYKLLKGGLSTPKEGCSHIVTTIQPNDANMHHDKGVAGAKVFLKENDGEEKEADVYLGQIFNRYTEWFQPVTSIKATAIAKKILQSDKTSSLAIGLANSLEELGDKLKHKSTSHDGAAIFLNVPNGEYTLRAEKEGMSFTTAMVEVLDNSPEFINIAPPQSPREISPYKQQLKMAK